MEIRHKKNGSVKAKTDIWNGKILEDRLCVEL